VPPPRRRSRTRHLAVAGVVALTAVTLLGSRLAHDRWLRTPEGINASHGTHLRPYTQGFKLVGVQRVPASGSLRIPAAPHEVIAPICTHFTLKSQSTWARIGDSQGHDMGPFPCAEQSAQRYYLSALDDTYTIRPPRNGGDDFLVARYARVPWDKYPVATGDFDVEHDQTMQSVLGLRQNKPAASGRTVTLRGTNGVATAVVPLPAAVSGTDLYVTGLLSPTSTGEFRITLGGHSITYCDALSVDSPWCRFYDRHVPQVQLFTSYEYVAMNGHRDPSTAARTLRVEVHHARGPWTLTIRFDRFRNSS